MTSSRQSNAPRSLLALLVAVVVLLAACGGSGAPGAAPELLAAADELPDPVVPIDIARCLTINPVGPATTPPSEACAVHGSALEGFHEGATLMEWVDYRPLEAGVVAAGIRLTADEIAVAERVAALESLAETYDQMEIDFSVRAPGVTSSRGSDAAYVEIVTREGWENYFETFFDGPTATADAAHVTERIFVRMRGFELN